MPGMKIIQFDTLSRLYSLDYDEDNDDEVLLSEHLFINVTDTGLEGLIKRHLINDPLFMAYSKAPASVSLSEHLSIKDGLMFFKNRCYVLDNGELKRQIVFNHHDLPSMGHPGQFGTTNLVSRAYWWPEMGTFIKNYVQGCATCQQNKINMHPTSPPLQPIPHYPDAKPFEFINADFITDLPKTK